MNDREKLIALIENAKRAMKSENLSCNIARNGFVADFLIANGVTIQRWIPVTERLPEDDVEVLTRRATGMSVESRCGFGWVYDEYNGRWEVTHWMPLPEPPIEEQNREKEVDTDEMQV